LMATPHKTMCFSSVKDKQPDINNKYAYWMLVARVFNMLLVN